MANRESLIILGHLFIKSVRERERERDGEKEREKERKVRERKTER